jgi:uncharacterized membrane protein (UPF0127 family)
MRKVSVANIDHPGAPPVEAAYCESFLSRLRGFTFRRSIRPHEGLILVQKLDNRLDASIHMLGVFTDLAVVWINSEFVVVDSRLARKWRPLYIPKKACRFVLEMNPQRLADYKPGDKVRFEDAN